MLAPHIADRSGGDDFPVLDDRDLVAEAMCDQIAIIQIAIFPCWMIAIWSHIASATSSVCVLINTVPPRSTNCRKMSFSRRAAFGSSPTIGSSTTMHSGR